jgi:hypothetical protein
MASSYDFFVTEGIDATRARVTAALEAQGFTAEASPNGGLIATRGSATRTLLLGAFAGKGLHLRFDTQFFTGDDGRIIVRVTRDLASGALKGGIIGAAKTADAFTEFANGIGGSLDSAGVLAETRPA